MAHTVWGPYYGLQLDSGGLELDDSFGKAVLTIKIQWYTIQYTLILDISLSKVCIL